MRLDDEDGCQLSPGGNSCIPLLGRLSLPAEPGVQGRETRMTSPADAAGLPR